MNICELSEGMVPTNKLSETHVRCIVQIKYEHVYITHSPSLHWRANQDGLKDPAFKIIAELFNRISSKDAFWNIELEKYARHFSLVYYTKNGGITIPEFIHLIKTEVVPVLKSKELEDRHITFFETAIDYDSIVIKETDFFKNRCR